VEVVASLSQGRTAAAQCGLFTHKSVPVIFEPPCISIYITLSPLLPNKLETYFVNISTVQLVLYRGKRKLLETCSNSKSSLQYVIT